MTLRRQLDRIEVARRRLHYCEHDLGGLWYNFGTMVRDARKARGMSLDALGNHLGCTGVMVGMMERGMRGWSICEAEIVVKLLGKHPTWPNSPGGLRQKKS